MLTAQVQAHTTSPIRSSYDEVLQRLAVQERGFAAQLPYRLRLTTDPRGGWEDYTRLELLYDMPLLVARDLCQGPSQEQLALYRFAHHCIGFCGLVKDRTADAQVRRSRELTRCYRALELVTRDAVRVAVGAGGGTHIREAAREWRLGVRAEKRALREKALDPADYARLVHQKTSWLTSVSLEMVERHGGPERVSHLASLMKMIILGLQARDDALDADEDEALHGCHFPRALGIDPLTLGTLGQFLLSQAVDVARKQGFPHLATWLETNQAPELIAALPGEPLLAPLGAFALAARFRAN